MGWTVLANSVEVLVVEYQVNEFEYFLALVVKIAHPLVNQKTPSRLAWNLVILEMKPIAHVSSA
jgi:hypothetical protein